MADETQDIRRRAQELFAALTLIEEGGTRRQHALTVTDLVAFLQGHKPLSHEQQRLLFSDQRLRQEFQYLKRDFAVHIASPRAGTRPLEMPTQAAAASEQEPEYRRRLEGGELKISPVGVGQQVYVIITLEEANVVPRALIVERARDQKVQHLALPPADDGEIILVKDLSVPADAELVNLLRDPTSTGSFVR